MDGRKVEKNLMREKTMKNSENQSVIVITGMHRSGTSLTASLLQKTGVDIGKRLVGAEYGNIKGHFENADFVEFHKSVFQFQGIDNLGCTFQREVPVPDEYQEQAHQLIAQQKSPMWGWKDPRTTLFLNFWDQLLPDAKYIFIYRSPWEVVDSLYRRATDDTLLEHPEIAVQMWIHYNHKVLDFYEKNPEKCLLANVYNVGNKSEYFVSQINEKFHVNLGKPPTDNFDKSLLVNDILNTHRPSLIVQYFAEAIELYLTLEVIAENLSRRAIAPESENILYPTSSVWAFQDWLEIRKLDKERKILKVERKEWQQQFEEAKEKVIILESQLGETQLKLDGTDVKLQEAIAKLIDTETRLGQSQLKYEGAEAKTQEALDKIFNLENVLGETQKKLKFTETKYSDALTKIIGTETRVHQGLWKLQKQYKESFAKLVETEKRLGETELKLESTENKLEAAMTKLFSLEEELGKTQGLRLASESRLEASESRLEASESRLEEAMTKIFQLENILGSTQGELEKVRVQKENALSEIIAMRSSKFWKLREKWAGVKHGVKNLKPRLLWSVDHPQRWENLSENLQIVGWCFHNQMSFTHIQARVGDDIFTGDYGIVREDVAQSFPYHSAAKKCGFTLEFKLSSGYHQIHLEAKDIYHKWHRFASYTVIISTISGAFDAPVSWEQREGEILFAGWCCHPEYKINKLTLHCGNIAIDCAYGLRRKDVGDVFPNWVGSDQSGFEALVNVPMGTWQVSLHAQLVTGENLTYYSPNLLLVTPYGIKEKLGDQTQELSRFLAAVKKRAAERKQRLGRIIPMPWEIPTILRRTQEIYTHQKQLSFGGELQPPTGFIVPEPIDPYDAWLLVNQWNDRARHALITRLNSTKNLPKISVIMPVYNTEIEFLEHAIASVVNQVYDHWELCIADDCSTDPKVRETLKKWAEKDDRVRITFREKNGNISAATNSAAELATGDFFLLLDHDDELTPNALGEVGLYLATHPETDFLYSDDDKIDTKGHRFAPQFKPDWSPQLLLSYMYLGHLCVVRRDIFQQLGGKRIGFEGAQDYDFALRSTEISRQVAHLPLILYHWRTAPGSTAVSGAAKPASFLAGERAIQDALERRSIKGKVDQPDWAVKENLGIFSIKFPDQGPSVTIIIPTKNKLSLLKECIDSLAKTTYKNYQIVIIDNESDEPEILEYFKKIPHQVLHIKNQEGKFSFAAINNRAVEQIKSDYILFLNNDTEVINPHWLSQMVGYAQMEGVGAVGARLLYPDERVQHAGIIHGYHHGLAGHAFKLIPRENRGYLSHAFLPRNYSAVTAACLLTPRQLFLELGGFDEETFAVAYNDVDYGFRLLESGFLSIYCPDAELIHKEGTSRGFNDNPKEVAAYRRKYAGTIDRFYSPHLSLANEYFEIQPRCYDVTPQGLTKNRVLMCSNSLDYTGAPLHQYEIAVGLAKKGMITPVIFCVTDGPLRQAYEALGIEVIIRDHPLEHIYQRSVYDGVLQEFSQEIEALNIDVMYINTLENFFMVDVAHLLKIPSVWNVHESQPWQTYFNRFGPEIAARALECFRFPYRVIFVADATRDRFLSLNSHRNFTVIHNGLDLSRLDKSLSREEARKILGVKPDELVLLVLGTVCERKGQKDLVKALSLLPKKTQNRSRCFIVGDSPSLYSNQLAMMVKELPEELQQKITIVPETPETSKYYRASDIFVCTSRVESFPRVILEAMAYDLPIITTPVFGIREQVRAGINGLFYTPDDAQELAGAIHHLVEKERDREKFSDNAKYVLASLNTFEEMTQAYGDIFQEAYFSSIGE